MRAGVSMHERVRRYAFMEIETICQDFEISEDGYQAEQVDKSRRNYGDNQLAGFSKNTIWHRLCRAFVNPFTVILFVLTVISFATDVLLASNFSRDISTTLIMCSMLVISGIIRFMQEMRSKRIIDHLTSFLHFNVMVRREGQWMEIPSSALVVGDIVRLFAGNRVPADIRLLKTKDLCMSQSVITGESAILQKDAAILSGVIPGAYSDYRNIAFMGSAITAGMGEGIVLAVGQDTVYGSFSKARSMRKSKFDQGANAIAWVFIRFMMVLVPVVFIACGLTKESWLSAFLFALSVAVGLTPEMLPMIINACLAKGSVAMGQKQTVVKDINAMQGFGSMDVLCVDKTGTLTGDTVLLEYYMDVLGNESGKVLDYAYLNSLYHTGVTNHLDTAILRCRAMPKHEAHFRKLADSYQKIDEKPFDYERKFVNVLVKNGEKNLWIVKGSVEEVCRCCRYVEYKGKCSPMESDYFSNVHAVVDEMLEDGMKVLAVAYRQTEKEQMQEDVHDLILLGYLVFFDAPKKTAADAIRKLKKLHVSVKVLTGDQQEVAISVCSRLGIDTRQILTGEELNHFTEDEKMCRIENATVFTGLSPKQKAEIIQTLQINGHTVGFLGDGMNDLPAIVESDVGISVDTAAEAVKESADVLLLKKDLLVLEEGIWEGRKAFFNMSKYIRITASSNFGNILSIVIASVFLPFFPMTAIQLLLLNLLYDTICLVLPWDQVDEETCSMPLEWSGRTLGRFMRFFGPVSSIFDIITFLFLFFIFCPAVCGGNFTSLSGSDVQAKFIALFQTGWFLESMWTQVLILHMLRTKKIPFVQSSPSASVMIVTTCGMLFFTVLTYTPVGSLIGLTAVPSVYFIFLIMIVMAYLMLMTMMKTYYIKKYHKLV